MPYMGKDGDVKIGAGPTAVAYMDSWSVKSNIGTAEVTGYGANSREYVHTLRDWSGSFSGTLDRSDTDQADLLDQAEDGTLASIACRFSVSTPTTDTRFWSGSAKVTGITINSAVADKVGVSFDVQGTSNLGWTCSSV